jgi:UDP-hydrolysing UDP-N-acetyl-D-glucosamine 2-epimerase
MKLLVGTVSRSDFGILSNLIAVLKKNKKFKLKTLVTGEHFSKKMGQTFNEIKNKKIKIDKRIKLSELSSEPTSVLKKSSEIIIKLTNYFKYNKPDLLIVLGDKYETFMISYCAFIQRVPIAHIHGGEKTAGSLDDTFRHQISKMSNIHFVEREAYKKRLIQLGEGPDTIAVVGSLSKENFSKTIFSSKKEIERKFKIKFYNKNIIFTYHPEADKKIDKKKISEIFLIIEKNPKIKFLITAPNLDIGSDYIRKVIKRKTKLQNVNYIKSFGQNYYFSVLNIVDGIIGNSSSGLIEVPYLKKFTINIGNRQDGRISEKTVINCTSNIKDIQKSLNSAYSKKHQKVLKMFKNKDSLIASKKILKKINNFKYKNYKYKIFNDINFKY